MRERRIFPSSAAKGKDFHHGKLHFRGRAQGLHRQTSIDKLHTWILEEIRDIGNYILILKHLELRRWNSNDAKATALYKMLYVKTGHLKIKRAFSQLEIKKFIDSQDSILKLIRNLSGLLQEIEKAEKRIRKWKNFGSALVGLIDSASDIEADRRRGRETVNEIIDDFLEAKKSLNTVFRLAKMMNNTITSKVEKSIFNRTLFLETCRRRRKNPQRNRKNTWT